MKNITCRIVLASLAVAAVVAPAHLSAQIASTALVIEGGTLIDGNGGLPLGNAAIVVEGDRITDVGVVGDVTYPPNAEVIDADGKFIVPGLWDAMVSYQWFYGEIMLNHGITSTIDVGIAGEIGAAYRDGVLLGKIRGPRAFTGISRFTTRPAGDTGLETVLTPGRTPSSAEETRELVRAFTAGGADIIMFQDGTLPLEYYRAGFDEARTAGMPVSTRAYGPIFGPREAAELVLVRKRRGSKGGLSWKRSCTLSQIRLVGKKADSPRARARRASPGPCVWPRKASIFRHRARALAGL